MIPSNLFYVLRLLSFKTHDSQILNLNPRPQNSNQFDAAALAQRRMWVYVRLIYNIYIYKY